MGEKRWYIVDFFDDKMYVGTDSTQAVYHSSEQLFVKNFRSRQEEEIFCEDMDLFAVFTALTEGMLVARVAVSLTYID